MSNNVLTLEQKNLIDELVAAYDIGPTEVMYFEGDPKPFIGYEASCVMINTLAPEVDSIDIEPTIGFVDSISLKCTITLHDGRKRSAVGVMNASEPVRGEHPQERYNTATSRAIRNALRVAGIDLIKRHDQLAKGSPFDEKVHQRTYRDSLLAQVHILGAEAGLILSGGEGGKAGWRSFLRKRYSVDSSSHLSDEWLADLISVLKGIVEPIQKAA